MRIGIFTVFLSALMLFSTPWDGKEAHAARSGCVSFNQVSGTHNWKFRNHCGSSLAVAYCVRYSYGNPSKYIGRFKLRRTLTVYLKNIQNRIVVRHCKLGSCVPRAPGC